MSVPASASPLGTTVSPPASAVIGDSPRPAGAGWLAPVIEELKPGSADQISIWKQRYDALYAIAYGNPMHIPWHRAGPSRALVEWLNTHGQTHVRPGASAVVVASGLGDDVAELAGRGYETWGFDASASAIAWSAARHPTHSDRFVQADLFAIPPAHLRRADFVVQIDTLSALPPDLWPRAIEQVASLARPRGTILIIERATCHSDVSAPAPPFGLAADQLRSLVESIGWALCTAIDEFQCDCVSADGTSREWRAAFRRG